MHTIHSKPRLTTKRVAVLAAVSTLAACMSFPAYVPPTGEQATAEVTADVRYSSRNFYEGFFVRGATKCNPIPGLRLIDPMMEDPPQVVVVAHHKSQQQTTRMPANVPVPLRFTFLRSDEVMTWDFVVVLEPGRSYAASLDTKTGPRFVDKSTQAEALRLPHNLFRANLKCP